MDNNKINQMLAAANGSNHVGEYPSGSYSPMPNRVGSVHAVSDLQEILSLRAQVEQFREAYKELSGAINDLDDCESDTKELEEVSAKVFAVMQYHYNNTFRHTPAQCLAERDAEIKAQAVEPIFNKLKAAHGETTHPRAKVYLCEEAFELAEEVMQLHQQAKGE